jgi:hypothetical protein
MKIVYQNDTDKGPGNGILRVSETPYPLSEQSWRFAVRRASDHQCLMSGGWQDAETLLVPHACVLEGEELLLFVGEDVVDQLDLLDRYRLTLVNHEGARADGIITLIDILYSRMRGGNAVSGVKAPPRTPAPVAQVQDPEPPGPMATPIIPPILPPEPPAPTSRRWILAACVVLALLLAAGAAWFSLGRHKGPGDAPPSVAETRSDQSVPPAPQLDASGKDEPKPQEAQGKNEAPPPTEDAAKAPVEKAPEEPTQAGKAEPSPPAQPETAQSSPPPPAAEPELSPRQRVQAFLRGKGAPDKALELSRTMPESSEGRDATFILLEVAAEAGVGEAMAPLGRFYDPTDPAPTGTIQKDPEQALHWYGKAKAAGVPDAQKQLDGVRAWLQQEANKGSVKAQMLLDKQR